MALDVKVIKKRDFAYTVELNGSIDNETSTDLETELKEIIDQKTKVVVLDLNGVDYISSAGIRVVIWAKKSLQEQQASFAMTNLKPQIKKVFDVMKILPMIDIFDDAPEADKYIDQLIKEETEKQSS